MLITAIVDKLCEFAAIQIEQNQLIMEIGQLRDLIAGYDNGLERILHNRDLHHRYGDTDLLSQNKTKYQLDLAGLQAKFDQNQARLKKIAEEIGLPVPA